MVEATRKDEKTVVTSGNSRLETLRISVGEQEISRIDGVFSSFRAKYWHSLHSIILEISQLNLLMKFPFTTKIKKKKRTKKY